MLLGMFFRESFAVASGFLGEEFLERLKDSEREGNKLNNSALKKHSCRDIKCDCLQWKPFISSVFPVRLVSSLAVKIIFGFRCLF